MKHAGPDALERLEPLLKRIRQRATLKERAPGTFYRAGRAFLHFHEHGTEFYADLRVDNDFVRLPATSPAEHKALLDRMDALIADGSPARPR